MQNIFNVTSPASFTVTQATDTTALLLALAGKLEIFIFLW